MLREQTTPSDRRHGVLLGLAIGDALGMPVDGLSHQNVRMYYKGIKAYRDDEHRGGAAGTGTRHTAALLDLATNTTLADVETTDATAIVLGGVAGAYPHVRLPSPTRSPAHVAASAQAWSVAYLLAETSQTFQVEVFWTALVAHVAALEKGEAGAPSSLASPLSTRLDRLTDSRDAFPLDLYDDCHGGMDAETGGSERAWLFATAMFARNPILIEATLLSAINAGGEAATAGALVGSLMGALHGAEAFPAEWHSGLSAYREIHAVAARLSR